MSGNSNFLRRGPWRGGGRHVRTLHYPRAHSPIFPAYPPSHERGLDKYEVDTAYRARVAAVAESTQPPPSHLSTLTTLATDLCFRSGGLNDAPMPLSLHRRREIRCGTKVFYAGLQITQLIDMESLSLRNCVMIETRKLPSMHFKSSKLRNDRALDSRHSGQYHRQIESLCINISRGSQPISGTRGTRSCKHH